MKNWKYILLAMILFPLVGMVSSCSDETTEEDEFDNWQQKNEAAIVQWASNPSYQKIVTYTKQPTTPGLASTDFIYVEVLESGSGTATPLYTDTCLVSYRGHYIPTTSYKDGLVFDQTYVGTFDWQTAGTTKFTPSESGLRDGFATALQHMHVGDRWLVRMPYTLGYGESDYSSIPGYSNLVFEIALYDFWHPGEKR